MINKEDRQRLQEQRKFRFSDIERIPPLKMMLYLGMVGSGIVFLFLLTSFILTLPDDAFANSRLPKFFILSSLLILSASFILHRALDHYENDKTSSLRSTLALTLSLGFLFALTQYIGWRELQLGGHNFSGIPSSSYIYVFSGVHLLHVGGGLLFLLMNYEHVTRRTTDPVKALIFFTDPYERLKLKLVTIYWHYLGAVWLVIFLILIFLFR